ncbi:DUF3486 family protein [Azospirillum sp. RWY-5-1]|uniref:DUF3486 family protein n=1 Tax=Azospirillum oleiclasticum TaxID=2735135 RepID=A0ABX2T6V7_9PROT|nr:phage protein Gp27 family protein [Azospirillum oleiclasticum]NYZ12876.1 DUF3486 family protein [Azospirillum oleiclasticum]NYZ20036.1 DUF3486 family protein [Azospirillum oleiclasticum]
MAGRPSKIDKLPDPLREGIAQLWHSGRYGLDEILRHLRDLSEGRRTMLPPELDVAVSVTADDLPSRSRLHAHLQGLDRVAEKVGRSRAVAEALVKRYGDEPESRTARLNIELAHSAVLDLFLAEGGGAGAGGDGEDGGAAPVTLDPEGVMFVARAIKDLASARKADAELALKLRQEFARKVDAKLKAIAADAGAVPATASPAEAKAALLRRIREEVYGIVERS